MLTKEYRRNSLREGTATENPPYATQTSSVRFYPSVSQPRTGVYPDESRATPMHYGGISQEPGRPEPVIVTDPPYSTPYSTPYATPYATPYSTPHYPSSGPVSQPPYSNPGFNTAGFPHYTSPTAYPIPNTQSSRRPAASNVPPFDNTQNLPSQYPSGYAPASYGPLSEHEPERRPSEYPRAAPTRIYEYGTARDPRPPESTEPLIHLKQELQLNVDEDLKKNMQVFGKKLDEQRRQLKQIEDAVVLQGNRVITAIREGPHDRIYDPVSLCVVSHAEALLTDHQELRAIWKEMV